VSVSLVCIPFVVNCWWRWFRNGHGATLRLGTGSSPHVALRVYGGQLELHTYLPVVPCVCSFPVCLLFLCVSALSLFNRDMANMKSFLSLLLLGLVGLVQALSSTGNRLLVVLEEASDKSKYSSFFGDLECELCLAISFARTWTD
jgi:hypothetical protein